MNDQTPEPVKMLLYCPNCFEQHVDEAKPDVCEKCGHDIDKHGAYGDGADGISPCLECDCDDYIAWFNPPHKSHRCNFCNHVWRPADVPTEGVQTLNSKGSRDLSPRPVAFANGKDFQDSVEVATPARVAPDTDEDVALCMAATASLIGRDEELEAALKAYFRCDHDHKSPTYKGWPMSVCDVCRGRASEESFEAGFDKGIEFASTVANERLGWVVIRSGDDLPKESGEYLWRYPTGGQEVRWYDASDEYNANIVRGYFDGCYEAYLPIPPYKQGETE